MLDAIDDELTMRNQPLRRLFHSRTACAEGARRRCGKLSATSKRRGSNTPKMPRPTSGQRTCHALRAYGDPRWEKSDELFGRPNLGRRSVIFPSARSGFLNRVRKFDSCRGHQPELDPMERTHSAASRSQEGVVGHPSPFHRCLDRRVSSLQICLFENRAGDTNMFVRPSQRSSTGPLRVDDLVDRELFDVRWPLHLHP